MDENKEAEVPKEPCMGELAELIDEAVRIREKREIEELVADEVLQALDR